jgi:predicted site-specific integrase-resolvase
MKDKTISELIKVLQEAGITQAETVEGAQQTLYSWIRKGYLTPRRKPHSGWYVFNDEEIAEIVDAFSTEGSGYWSYTESKT